MRLHELEKILQRAWSRETSSDPENWTKENPAWGQCAVTALIVQDYFGGELQRCEANGLSHYRNKLNGEIVDLTEVQFDNVLIENEAPRDREYVLSFPETIKRYEILKTRVFNRVTDPGG